ncbi:MAG: tRNA pseudouridine(55) synthase TruB [Gemmatimonadales bacterium]
MDKPAGLTSHDVVSRVRRALKTRAVGHTGTLDPFATGLLVVLAGRATRLARFVEQQAKTYLAGARLGIVTSTDDLTGEVIEGGQAGRRTGGQPSRAEVEMALREFLGPQKQRPPAYSAKKIDGERSYAKARRGETVALADVDIVVHAIELVAYDYPELVFRTTVSAGTYVRAIGRDLGERLGTGAHLTALRREAIGALRVEDAVALEQVSAESVRPPLSVLGHLDRIDVSEDETKALGHGKALPDRLTACPPDRPLAAVAHGDRLIAIGYASEGSFRPAVVLEPAG